MKTLSDDQVRHLASDIVAQMLTRVSDPEPERRRALEQAIKLWLPGADPMDLRALAPKVAHCIGGLATLVDERKGRMIEKGQAAPYG